jgi:hypothetical protein
MDFLTWLEDNNYTMANSPIAQKRNQAFMKFRDVYAMWSQARKSASVYLTAQDQLPLVRVEKAFVQNLGPFIQMASNGNVNATARDTLPITSDKTLPPRSMMSGAETLPLQ